MFNGKDFLDFMLRPYAEKDEFLNDWIDHSIGSVRWNIFEKQEDFVYMLGELKKGSLPKFKEDAYWKIEKAVIDEIYDIIDYMVYRIILEIHLGNVDLSDNIIESLKNFMDEEEFEDFELECRNRIFKDYAKNLGEYRTKELTNQWWGEGWDK